MCPLPMKRGRRGEYHHSISPHPPTDSDEEKKEPGAPPTTAEEGEEDATTFTSAEKGEGGTGRASMSEGEGEARNIDDVLDALHTFVRLTKCVGRHMIGLNEYIYFLVCFT